MERSESDPSASNPDNSNGHPPDEAGGANPSPSLVPPYWSHRRYESYSSVKIAKPAPITLEDHTEEPCEQSAAVWAKGVGIDDYVLVSGTVPSVGNFVVWNCKVETLDVSLIYLFFSLFFFLFYFLHEMVLSLFPLVSFCGSFCHTNRFQGRVHHHKKKVWAKSIPS